MFKSNKTITAIEIGTSAIKVITAKPLEDGTLMALAYDEVPTLNRVVKGEVVNVPAIEASLSEALNNIESISGKRITSVYLAVTGNHIHSTNVIGSVPITSPNRVITESDIIDATRNARSFNLPLEQQGIHTFQRNYVVDDNRRVNNPEGMVANKLTADVHVIYGNYNKIQTICSLVNDVLGVPANDIAFAGIADYYGTSANGEPTKGTLIIDIGAGVTEFALFYKTGCLHSGQIAVGCDHIVNDLSIGLKLPVAKCHEILKRQGCAIQKKESENKVINIEMSVGQTARTFKESVLQQIIELRLREIFEIVKSELTKTSLDDNLNMTQFMNDGIKLCGGGAAIPNVAVLAELIFNVPVKIGLPVNISGIDAEINSPRYVTTVGLLHLGNMYNKMDTESSLTFWEALKSEVVNVFTTLMKAFRF